MRKCDIGTNCSIASKRHHTNADGQTLCNKHYLQTRRHGKVVVTNRDKRQAIIEGEIAKIPLGVNAKDGYAVVDKEFAYLASDNWGMTHYGYAKRSADKTLMHRLIGECPREMVVDHIDGDKLNNTRKNLRVCKQSENSRNQKLSIKNTTGYRGVSRSGRLYRARIKFNYEPIELGYYDCAKIAARAYNNAARRYHGEFARLNHV